MKTIITILICAVCITAFGQQHIAKHNDVVQNDLVWHGITYPTFEMPQDKRIDADTSKWMLYKIDYNSKTPYHYFRLISYGLVNEYGWSDAMAHFERNYTTDKLLYGWCKISDTIPEQIITHKSNSIKPDTTYYVEGIFGERVR